MGMFDYVECRYPLPGASAEEQKSMFSTKDFDGPSLDVYVIEEDGRLFVERDGVMERVDDFWEDVVFGTSTDDGWVEYHVVFYDGVVKRIRRLKS